MKPGQPVAALVDAYTAGQYLPPAFTALGASVIHVQSTTELIASMPAPDLSVYDAVLVHESLTETAEQLRRFPVICVVAGMEPGVRLADELSDALGVPTNGASSTSGRRDKYVMIETLRAAGLHCARQFKSGDPDALVDWAAREGSYPYVVKPLDSGATDSVCFCRTPAELRQAVHETLARRTIFGQPNDQVLVQSFLDGDEYVVDMVSYAGSRYVCGVWKYRKRVVGGRHPIYDTEWLVAADEDPVPELIDYTNAALDALNVRFGPSHAEVMFTADGPALVEVGVRMAGGMNPAFHDFCAGANQADVTALAFMQPVEFLRSYGGKTYSKHKEAVCYMTPTALDGTVVGIDQEIVTEIKELNSVFRMEVKNRVGDRLKPTVDLFTSTLRVLMAGDSPGEIVDDHRRIQGLKDRVYVVS